MPLVFFPVYYYHISYRNSAKSTHVYERENRSLIKVRRLCPVVSVSPWAATVCLPQGTAAKPDDDNRVGGPLLIGLLVIASTDLSHCVCCGSEHDKAVFKESIGGIKPMHSLLFSWGQAAV